jgi:thiamine-phosphate pyrophosphorylase
MQFPRPVLSLITDRSRVGGVAPLAGFAALAARAGVTLIQVRERDLPDREVLALARDIVSATRGSASTILVNDRTDIALAAGAGGVHLRGDSAAASRVRAIVPASFVVGRSVHSVEEALAVERDGGVDYLVFGTVFESASKPGLPAAGIHALEELCRRVRLPVLAIGGVTAARAAHVAAAGAAGVAGIGMFLEAGNSGFASLVATLQRAFDT